MEIIAILILVAVLLVAEQLVFRKYVLRGVTYSVRFSVSEATEGEVIEIVEEIENNKALPVPWIKTEICTSRWLMFTGSSAARGSDARFVPSIFSLKPHQKCTRTRTVTALKRGLFRLENASLVGTDILGLVSVSKTVTIDETVRILPSPYELSEGDLSDKELYGELVTRRFICEDIFLISGAREYTGREPMNRIHWSSTARNGELMAFNNDYSTSNNMLIALNMQKNPEGDPRPLITGDLETYIKAAAFILEMTEKHKISADFTTNGHKKRGVYLSGGSERAGILRLLSELENECETDFFAHLENLDFRSKTDIFIITSYIDERMISFAKTQKRYGRNVVFYCNDSVTDEFPIVRLGRVNRYYFMNSEE